MEDLNAPTPLSSPAQEAFGVFNQRFHQDSLFQLSRIAFPIGGKNRNGMMSQSWNLNNWELFKVPVMETPETNQYQHSLHQTDSLVVETYWIEDSGFKLERQFNKIRGNWFLTYYDNMDI